MKIMTQTVKLWDVQTGRVIKTFYGHTDWVLSVSISADCTTIASGSDDKTICLWDIWTRECHCVIKQHNPVGRVRFSPTNSGHIISESGGKVWKWDVDGHQINPTVTFCAILCLRQINIFLSYDEVHFHTTTNFITIITNHFSHITTHQTTTKISLRNSNI